MWRALGAVLAPKAHVVIRFGATRLTPDEMFRMPTASARFSSGKTRLVNSDVSPLKGRQTDAFRPAAKARLPFCNVVTLQHSCTARANHKCPFTGRNVFGSPFQNYTAIRFGLLDPCAGVPP
jgi:hypothetical protein